MEWVGHPLEGLSLGSCALGDMVGLIAMLDCVVCVLCNAVMNACFVRLRLCRMCSSL